MIAITRCPGKPNPHLKIIRAAAEALRNKAEAKIDWARVAAAHAARPGPQAQPVAPPLEAAPSREECPRCGIPGWKGCAHFLPCDTLPPLVLREAKADGRKPVKFTGLRRGISVLRG